MTMGPRSALMRMLWFLFGAVSIFQTSASLAERRALTLSPMRRTRLRGISCAACPTAPAGHRPGSPPRSRRRCRRSCRSGLGARHRRRDSRGPSSYQRSSRSGLLSVWAQGDRSIVVDDEASVLVLAALDDPRALPGVVAAQDTWDLVERAADLQEVLAPARRVPFARHDVRELVQASLARIE